MAFKASSRSKKVISGGSVAALVNAARGGSLASGQGPGGPRRGGSDMMDEEAWGTVAQIVEKATQKVSCFVLEA